MGYSLKAQWRFNAYISHNSEQAGGTFETYILSIVGLLKYSHETNAKKSSQLSFRIAHFTGKIEHFEIRPPRRLFI